MPQHAPRGRIKATTAPMAERLRKLVEFWRQEATDRNHHDMKALCYRTCADDLEDALNSTRSGMKS